jgi:hypothetical protein
MARLFMGKNSPRSTPGRTALFLAGFLCLGMTTLSACEALDLINSVGTVLAPTSSASPDPNATPSPGSSPAPGASPNPTDASPAASNPVTITGGIDVIKASDPVPVSTDWNLARKAGSTLQVSSFKDATLDKARLTDGKLDTSWFAADSDTPAQGKLPTIEVQFASAVGLLSLNLRGDRQQSKGLLIEEINILAIGTAGVLANETLKITPADQDVNLVFKKPLDNVKSLRLTLTRSTGTPGLAELEILGR